MTTTLDPVDVPTMHHMGPLDALFLDAEDDIAHMHIGSCAIFRGPVPPMDDLQRLVEAKLPLLERYRQRVRFVPGNLGRPVWVDDPTFDIGYHVRLTALPAPGDEAALERLMGRLMSAPLDRRRPLWETWIVEGLADDRWAMISKVHHCMVDGISGTDLMATMLDADPDAPIPPVEPWVPRPAPSEATLLADALTRLATSPARQLRLFRSALVGPRGALHQLGEIVDGLRSYGERLVSPPPLLSIEGSIGPHRRWAAARCSLDEIRTIKQALGGSVNDVVLAVIAGAFRELLIERGDPVDGLVVRTLVPVSVRTPGDHTSNNQVTAMIADLPVGIADPVARLHAVMQHMQVLKGSHQATAGAAVASAADLAPPAMLSFGVRGLVELTKRLPQRSVNTVTTNVPGPRSTLYAAGCEMLEYLPFVPLHQGVRVGIAILTYDGHVAFGVTGDFDTVPDTASMARHIEDAVGELVRIAADT